MIPKSYEYNEKNYNFVSKYLGDLANKNKEFNHNVVVGVSKKECECIATMLNS